MLAINERLAAEAFSTLQQERIPLLRDRRRVEAEHRAHLEASTPERATGHEHSPVQRPELIIAARPTLLVVLAEDEAVEHEIPASLHRMNRRQADGIGNPGGARSHAVHRDA